MHDTNAIACLISIACAVARQSRGWSAKTLDIDAETLSYDNRLVIILRSSVHDLAVMGATSANGGVNPMTGVRAVAAEYVKDMLSIMLTCGMYDYAGEWAFRVGIPAKSGVTGGGVAVVPGKVGIGVFSPRLDRKGNSVRGVKVCEELSRRFGLHAFESSAARDLLSAELQPQRSH